jgi:hypothetical protein
MSTSGDNESSAQHGRKPLPDCLTRLLRHQGVEVCSGRPAAATSNRKGYVHVLAATWVELDRLADLAGAPGDATSKLAPRR